LLEDEFFPFAEFRSGQAEALEAIRNRLEEGVRVVLLDAPTGSGKSAIGYAVARRFAPSYLVTTQKVLQDQYLNDFADLASIKGRSNYQCLVVPVDAAQAPCLVGNLYPECEECPYFVAKAQAQAAQVALMNGSYLLAEANFVGGFAARRLLVIDEAHTLVQTICDHLSVHLDPAVLEGAGLAGARVPRDWEGLDDLLDLAVKAKLPDDDAHQATLVRARRKALRGGLERWRRTWPETSWVIDETDRGITLRPVWPGGLAKEACLDLGDQVVMMSATLLDPDLTARSLGLESHEVAWVRLDSAFPARNRPVRIPPRGTGARMHRSELERSGLPRLVEMVSAILDDHPAEKGVIHTHTYRIAQSLVEQLPARHQGRLLAPMRTGERPIALDRHRQNPWPSVLLSPSLNQGVDLADDLARFQVICKLPFPFLGDQVVRERMSADPAWYDVETAVDLIQAYGRSVRGPEDWAVTYVLDEGWWPFARRMGERLPKWFTQAISSWEGVPGSNGEAVS